jgi:hypothetical protein
MAYEIEANSGPHPETSVVIGPNAPWRAATVCGIAHRIAVGNGQLRRRHLAWWRQPEPSRNVLPFNEHGTVGLFQSNPWVRRLVNAAAFTTRFTAIRRFQFAFRYHVRTSPNVDDRRVPLDVLSVKTVFSSRLKHGARDQRLAWLSSLPYQHPGRRRIRSSEEPKRADAASDRDPAN